MASAVQARSLSSLISLASSPPQYPRNPALPALDRVVLYITRVPGSRDVFLTPIKPREKIVTAEDVCSSLYYVHVDDSNDGSDPPDGVLMSESNNRASHAGPREYTRAAGRKPLPQLPLEPQLSAEEHPPLSPRNLMPPPPLPNRLADSTVAGSNRATVSRKPVGSNHRHRKGFSVDIPFRPKQENMKENVKHSIDTGIVPPHVCHTGRFSEELDEDSLRGNFSELNSSIDQRSPQRSTPANIANLVHNTGSGVTLILIRRDPSSGAQWNVAKMRDYSTFAASTHRPQITATHKTKSDCAPVDIDITNPGYSKFRSTDANVHGQNPGENVPFQRCLEMESSRPPSTASSHSRLKSDSSISYNPALSASDLGQSNDSRPQLLTVGSSGSLFTGRNNSLAGQGAPAIERSAKPKGYAFNSPWGGKCEFATGSTGSTLKCKHTPPVVGASIFPTSAVVSELRFNLPHVSRSKKKLGTDSATRSRANSYSAQAPSIQRQGPDFDDLEKLDLTLGQESAGGGFGGKHAKLGKLVLEDEGLKMMDLLVAANMSLWWRAYERTS
ncbi:hypothetical protein BDY21DRAFT_344303 [Lineolata rhizophorae]|uniref:Uncharacterized protein n=1 Tax=Lineolata rhizophorae TaxID=578093 RepID=A0A6A6P0T0_9PEZI|nr:hypothetical protein BDY21DRAFT_344303 [Lineolata rhizophorae]